MRLPAALQPWSEPLSALDAELAIALGPLVRQLDQLVTRQDPGPGPHGPLDGYDGITRQGSPSRLLASEWALAEAVPAEFLRRAASAELLYLNPAYQQDRQRAGIAVLVDTGPDQIGAARLVQLAGLVMMLRRSSARGHQLSLGILGDEPGQWRSGEPETLLRGWLAARRAADPDPEAIDRWAAEADDPDEVWLLAGPRLAATLPGRRRMLVARECAWDQDGATAAEVRLDGDRIELALPRHHLAIRALRGAGFRTSAAEQPRTDGRLRFPAFTGAPLRLLARGNGPQELVGVTISARGHGAGRPRKYQLRGPILAASVFSQRTVALVLVDEMLQVEVIGKPLGHLDELAVPLDQVGLTTADVDAARDQPLPPVFFGSGALLCRLNDEWWRLHPDEPPRIVDLLAVAPSRKLDEPRIAVRFRGLAQISSPRMHLKGADRIVFGQDQLIAWYDQDTWVVEPGRVRIRVPDNAEPFGLLSLNDVPTLICRSSAGLLIRLCTAAGYRTLTNWPYVRNTPSLHPFEPILAIELADRVEVIDLTDDQVLATLRSGE
jgi:hypothetical protein